jgi:hypothetical protein
VLDLLNDNQFILLFLKIRQGKGKYKTLDPLQKIKKSDFDDLLNRYENILDIKDEQYHITPIDQLIFSYIIIPADKLKSEKSVISNGEDNKKVEAFKMHGWKLPGTVDLKT